MMHLLYHLLMMRDVPEMGPRNMKRGAWDFCSEVLHMIEDDSLSVWEVLLMMLGAVAVVIALGWAIPRIRQRRRED